MEGGTTSASDDEEKRDGEREGDVVDGTRNGMRSVIGVGKTKGGKVITLPPCKV